MARTLSATALLLAVMSWRPVEAAYVLNLLTPYEQDFDFLAASGASNAWHNDGPSGPSTSGSPGWYWQNGSGSLTYEGGFPFGPNAFSLGIGTDRAMGNYASATNATTAWGFVLQNDTGESITSVTIAYTGEQWRTNDTITNETLQFSLRVASAEITDLVPTEGAIPSGWTHVAALDFEAPQTTATAGIADGSTSEYYTEFSEELSINVPDGQFLALRWFDGDDAGSDAALGVDSLTVSFTASAVPEAGAFLNGAIVCAAVALLVVGGRISKRKSASRWRNCRATMPAWGLDRSSGPRR